MDKRFIIGFGILALVAIAAAFIGVIPLWLLVPIAMGAFVVRGLGRSADIKTLSAHGVATTAIVTHKRTLGNGSFRTMILRYAYQTPSGRIEARTQGRRGDFENVAVGDTIDIVHLPDKPRISAPSWVLAQTTPGAAAK